MSYSDKFEEALEKELKKKKKKNASANTNTSGSKAKNDYSSNFDRALEKEMGGDRHPVKYAPSVFADDDDIAPVAGDGGKKNSWFKSGGFSDGVDGVGDFFGDLGETALGTAADLGIGVVKGAGRMVEGLVDLGTYGVAKAADAFGADEFAEKAKRAARYSATDEWTKDAQSVADRYSILGDKADMVSEGLGQVGAIILTGGVAGAAGLGGAGVAAVTTGVTGLSSMGTNMGAAFDSGATDKDAFMYGLSTGAIEAGTELLFGGLGKGVKALGISRGIGGLDDIFAKKLASKIAGSITNEGVQKALGNTIEYAVKSSGEGLEEVLSGLGSAVMKKLTYEDDESLQKLIADENLLEQFVVGAVTSSIAQGADFVKATKSGTDLVTGHTAADEKVVSKVVEDEIARREKAGETLSTKDKNEIYDAVVEQMEHGQIDIDTIEEVLGGDAYKAYKDTVESEDALKTELDELRKMKSSDMNDLQVERMNELKGMNLDDTTKRDELRKNLVDTLRPMMKGSKLQASYREANNRKRAFEADLSKYKGKQKEAVERAVKSGVLNNTYRSHELVDVLSKIEAEKGIVFDYTNNAKLKESGFAVEGKTVNGFANKNKGTVTLNVQSNKAWQFVVGHEITHVLETNPEAYNALRESLYAYAESKGELESRRAATTALYDGMDADIEAELTADLVGDYLFTDKDFVSNLTGNRTLFQKIYDEIKYLWNKATGKEKTEIEKVKDEFDRVWKEFQVKNTDSKADDGKVQHSLTAVDAVQPKSDKWARTHTTEEAMAVFPDMWNVSAEESEVRNPTQITSTVNTYRKIYNILQNEGFDGKILDASSGLGYGTKAGIEEYGFDVEDIEPYPDANYTPKYQDYSTLDEKYDVIISNAVLNVLPQDQRDALAVKMGELLNDGGRLFVNVRGKDVETLAKTGKNIHLGNMEWIETVKGSYQKGFTKPELVAYLQDALGDGFTVEPTNMFGGVAAVVTKDGGVSSAVAEDRKIEIDRQIEEDAVAESKSNEEAFADSATAVQYSIRPPYSDGSKSFIEFSDNLSPDAKSTFDMFYGFYQKSRITNALSVSGKRVKGVNISSLYLRAQEWNDMLNADEKWRVAAQDLADFLPKEVRERMRMNPDGTLIPNPMEEEFKMPSSLAQRLVDSLPYEMIDSTYTLGDKTITLPEGKARQSVGGESYRRAIINETRKLYQEGKLKQVGIGTMSKDRWGSLGFLAANGKTGASGDFTTVCPQMMFNRGCWYCYRRAAMEKGVNNKLVANNVWYTGEILRIKDSDIKQLNENGGLRIQSFGDWMPHFSAMLADVLYDAELRGLQVKIITKEPSMINYIAALREQGIGKNLYFNLSADYTIEEASSGTGELDAVNPERPFQRRDSGFWWKRAMTVEEAAKYREKYPWVNTRIVATDLGEFIRGLKDPRVDVVTGYHGNIREFERVDSTTGEHKVMVEALGDAGMPRFAYNPVTNEWVTEYEGKTQTHKKLAEAIAREGLQMEYYTKTCCITGRCASCKGKCGALARDFNIKNATNRDAESVAYWQKEMQYGIEPEFGDMTQHSEDIAPTPDVQYSISPDTDADYMSAVERGDTETAQMMVNEAAKNAGYTRKLYHGTASKFNVFGFGRTGIFTTDNFDMAKTYGNNVMSLYGKEGAKVLHIDAKESPHWSIEVSKDVLDFSEYPLMRGKNRYSTNDISLIAFREGYDVVVIDNVYDNYSAASGNTENGLGTDVVYKDPNQVKSSEAVTYDDNGNVIPLSQRFNEKSDDIRNSLSNDGEEYAPVGNYSTPFRELAYGDDITPTPKTVRETPKTEEAPSLADIPVLSDEELEGGTYAAIRPEKKKPVAPKSERIADGSRSDELLYDSLDNHPVQTIEQKIAEKIRALHGELADRKDLRREKWDDYESRIADLRAKYNAKKNKNTKEASKILQSISRLERMKASDDADFSKRISDLEARIQKMSDPKYGVAMQKRAKMEADAKWAADLLGDTSTWVDKKIGLQYATNTERRNLRDIVRDENGNVDIAKADAIDDALNGQYNRDEAAKKRELANVRGKYADLGITKAEDVYIQMLGELRHNPDTSLTELDVTEYYEKHRDKIDTAKVDMVIEMARQDYDDFLNRVNAELKKQGMKEIPYRQGYFPHFTEPKQNFIQKLLNWKVQDNEIPTSIAGLTETFKPTRSWQSFDKRRYSDETDYSFMKGFDSYSEGALDWIYHMDTLQKRRAVENHIRYTHSDEGISDRIKAVYASEDIDANEAQAQIEHILSEAKNPLNNFVQDFTTHTNILAGKKNSLDRTVEQWTNRHIYSVMTNVQNRMSANMVLANVRSAMTNFIPITQSWAQVSPLRSLQAVKQTIANSIKDDGTVDKSTFLTNRLREVDKLYQTNWDKVLDKAGIMFEIVDNISSQVIWRSKYNQNLADGMTEAQAIRNADQFAENVMAGRSKGNEPTLFNAKNPFVKAFTMFQLEVNNQYGYLFKDVPNDLKAETEHWKFNLAKGYTAVFVGAYIYNALLEKVTGSDAALDPIAIVEELLRDLGLFGDDEEEEPEKIVTNLVGNVVEELPFVGGVLGGGRIPISSAIPYGGEYGGGLSGFVEDVGNIGDGGLKNIGKEMMNPILNVGLPVGGGQIKKSVQGLKMFSDDHPVTGSYTDSGKLRFPVEDTPLNKAQAFVFGQYASKNAREYFDNEYAPLGEKQIQEYMDVDMPIKDYWEYREGLSDLAPLPGKTSVSLEQKLDYVDGMDLPTRKKNILANNLTERKDPIDMTSYGDYDSLEEFDYATKNPEKYALAKSVGGYSAYKTYSGELYDIKADKDASGKSINGSRKEKVIDYINNLDADYYTKIILYKSEYPSDDTYNYEIVNHINNRSDMSYDERIALLTELGFRVTADGKIYAD